MSIRTHSFLFLNNRKNSIVPHDPANQNKKAPKLIPGVLKKDILY